ncbi:amino acid ABC transporter ATP-binding protein [Lacrimispora indolis]|uniref:amino acid ABC transporter ATP-binding protein n=1 Tax=Lacrimispora indolis TaxID=69825 RepID=UPI0003FC452D|nr:MULTISPECIES: amino acid ABC transporter ATP-binding protein [Lachnospiraceae]MBE7719184.1 amino acid ABC transporter ATP-binding protein [Lacrimispora celerecrescens]
MIEMENVKKSFGNSQILKGISIRVKKGDVTVIIGPSGSGKTTLLRCINFLEKADEGKLTIDDLTVNMKKSSKKETLNIRRKCAFVFQNYGLFLNKTALENVMEGLVAVQKKSKEEAKKIAVETLEWVGLSDRMDYYPVNLSGGQQQRVGIARAVALSPKVILFDEPTSALDPELVGETLELIKKVAQTGITMIVVTHEMSFAQEVASQVIFMDEGLVVETGTPKEIFGKPKNERTKQFLTRINSQDSIYYI